MDNYEFGEFTNIYKKRFNNVDDYLCLIAMEYDVIEVCKCLLNFTNITASNMSQSLYMPPEAARGIISNLLKNGCIVPKGHYFNYVKTSIFTTYLQKVIDNKMSIKNKR